ncbi:MAG: Spy/CpxP family protein refolding chaperone [Rubrivivax sp.]|nr:Spy/CpxP family protein refolding chaperone [Rubrivivax sp.]
MKTWIKRTLIVGTVGAVLLGGFAAFAHRAHHGWRTMDAAQLTEAKTRVVERVASRMDLDAAQKARLAVLGDRLLEQRAALLAGGDPRAAVQGLVAGASFDRAGAEALLIAKTDALRQGAPAVIAAFGDFYDGLRPEQQQQLRERLARGGEHRRRGRDD